MYTFLKTTKSDSILQNLTPELTKNYRLKRLISIKMDQNRSRMAKRDENRLNTFRTQHSRNISSKMSSSKYRTTFPEQANIEESVEVDYIVYNFQSISEIHNFSTQYCSQT